MRISNRTSLIRLVAVVATATALLAGPADASRCLYPGDTAKGATRSSIQAARNSAMASWERAVIKKHGRRYANWYYAGDGSVDCSWNDRGNKIVCRARAVPCAD